VAPSLREVMTPRPATATIVDAARAMRDTNIGDVIVMKDNRIWGIVTDRDIAVRVVADGGNPATTRLDEICSRDLTTLAPNDSTDDAVRVMREQPIRRLPVVEKGEPIGVVSIGDLAVERDPDSALADISAALPNT